MRMNTEVECLYCSKKFVGITPNKSVDLMKKHLKDAHPSKAIN